MAVWCQPSTYAPRAAGVACTGAGKPTAVYVPGMREPDLMVKMADLVTADLAELCNWARTLKREDVRTTHAVDAMSSSANGLHGGDRALASSASSS